MTAGLVYLECGMVGYFQRFFRMTPLTRVTNSAAAAADGEEVVEVMVPMSNDLNKGMPCCSLAEERCGCCPKGGVMRSRMPSSAQQQQQSPCCTRLKLKPIHDDDPAHVGTTPINTQSISKRQQQQSASNIHQQQQQQACAFQRQQQRPATTVTTSYIHRIISVHSAVV